MIETNANTVQNSMKETTKKVKESAIQSSMEIIETSSLESLKAQNELIAEKINQA